MSRPSMLAAARRDGEREACGPPKKGQDRARRDPASDLGAQVLFGFQLNGVFQEAYADLSRTSRLLNCAGQLFMAIAIALLIVPSMQHRIVENGQNTNRILAVATRFAGLALLPFGASLGISIYIRSSTCLGGQRRSPPA